MPARQADLCGDRNLDVFVLSAMRRQTIIDLVGIDLIQPYGADRHIVHDVVRRPAAGCGIPLIQIDRIIPRRHSEDALVSIQFRVRCILILRPHAILNDLVFLLRRNHIEKVCAVEVVGRIDEFHLQGRDLADRPVLHAPDVGAHVIIHIQANILRREPDVAYLRLKPHLVRVQRLKTLITETAALCTECADIDNLKTWKHRLRHRQFLDAHPLPAACCRHNQFRGTVRAAIGRVEGVCLIELVSD